MSMGGCAVLTFNASENDELESGSLVSSIEVYLDYKHVVLSGTVVVRSGSLVAIRFTSIGMKEKKTLARYIFRRLSR
jgi:c-di-GMP-binding flagellar brake protein YcgR